MYSENEDRKTEFDASIIGGVIGLFIVLLTATLIVLTGWTGPG